MHKIIHLTTTTTVVPIIVTVVATTITSVFASGPCESGFIHGVSDAQEATHRNS